MIVILVCVPILMGAASFPKPTDKFFVNDFAGVINSEDEEKIYGIGADLYNKTTAQVVVVTVDTLEGQDIRDYGYRLGREWGVGQAGQNNGVLLILAVQDRQVGIETGYGLEGVLTDLKTGQILDTYAMPYLRQNDYSTAMVQAYGALVNELAKYYNVEIDSEIAVEQGTDSFDLMRVLGVLILVLFISSFFGSGRRFIFFPGFFRFGGRGGFGGFSGGGRGGFGGFSGEGGSFGGGGSSRRF